MEFAKTLYLYGPFALLALLVFVMEAKARRQLNTPEASKALRVSIYAATWLSIFVCCAITVWIWVILNVPNTEQIIRGRLTGLRGYEDLRSKSKDMFVRRIYDSSSSFDYVFRIISSTKLPANSLIDLWIDRSTTDSEDVSFYDLPISPEFYNSDTELLLVYERDRRKLNLQVGGGWIELKEGNRAATIVSEAPAWPELALKWLTPSVHAQASPDFQSIARRLESNDAIIRHEARAELAKMGPAAADSIQQILNSPDSSYRLRLGVLVALNEMPAESIRLNSNANCALLKATWDSDETIRDQATRFVSSHPKLDLGPDCQRLQCQSPQFAKLATRGVQPLTIANASVYVYLAGISAADAADVYVINSQNRLWGVLDAGKLPKKSFKEGIRKLKPARGFLLPETYERRRLKRGQGFDASLTRSAKLRVSVTETHYFNDWAGLLVCP